MKMLITILALSINLTTVFAQSGLRTVDVYINAGNELGIISPSIYGSNGQSDDRDENIAARRQGGNRLTGYNWETNASSAGADYFHQNDNYLTWVMGLSGPDELIPGIVTTKFHDESVATNTYSLVTLQAAGYVANDKAGSVAESETAPSSRWLPVTFKKNGPFLSDPDLNDGTVYMDEFVAFLESKYGDASSPTGIRGYSLDNEPCLWSSTHPRIHPNPAACKELIDKNAELAGAVKAVDPQAEVFGPALYGFGAYLNFQSAPDWNTYEHYGDFINAYLAEMKKKSDSAGVRLLDVLDLHWYPEATGKDNAGNDVRIAFSDNADPGVAEARMQAPRTLWDPNYKENSWIGTWFSPVVLLPKLQESIAVHYPGTKLAFTEFNYGGSTHISGGIAIADVLGLFGKYDVYMSNHWGDLSGFVSAGYKIYRNYDGAKSTFGDRRVESVCEDTAYTSVYASMHRDSTLHLVLLNKHQTDELQAAVMIGGTKIFATGHAWQLGAASPKIQNAGSVTVSHNALMVTVPPTSVTHYVLRRSPLEVENEAAARESALDIYPNPVQGGVSTVRYALSEHSRMRLSLVNFLGKEVMELRNGEVEAGAYTATLNASSLVPGMYFVRLEGQNVQQTAPLLIVR